MVADANQDSLPERKLGARRPLLIMVLHWNCWALILPVLWLVFLPCRHLFSSFALFGCVCLESSRGSCLIKWMLFKKYILMHVIANQWRDSSSQKFTASLSSFCPWLNTIMSLICCIFHAIFFPKGIYFEQVFVLQPNGTFKRNVNHYKVWCNTYLLFNIFILYNCCFCVKKVQFSAKFQRRICV